MLATADTTDLKRQLANATNDLTSAQVSLRAAEDASTTPRRDGRPIRQAKIGRYNALNQVARPRRRSTTCRTQIDARDAHGPDRRDRHRGQRRQGLRAPVRRRRSSSTRRPTRSPPTSSRATSRDVKVGQEATVTVAAIDADVDGHRDRDRADGRADSGSGVVSYPVTVTLTDAPATRPRPG